MRNIDVNKVRDAILSLQSNGKTGYASAVWDLLDFYIGRQPISLASPAATAAMDGPRGASSLPLCQISRYNTTEAHCDAPATGSLVNARHSAPACTAHGEEFDGRNGAEWVQTLFGDENSVDGLATRTLTCVLEASYVGEYAKPCHDPVTGYIHRSGSDIDGCEEHGRLHGTTVEPFTRYA